MATTTITSPILAVPTRAPEDAVAYFSANLAFQTDVSDVRAALDLDEPGFALVDSRGQVAWAQGHIPGAIHLPTAEIPTRAHALLDPGVPVVTYCWGPGCDGAAKAALALARLGFRVKEMRGGIEYWIREGLAVETTEGLTQRPADPLTAPVNAVACDC
ncbi:rhodanese-like domain-containing protein [Actinopolymorpha alba]|uniref:rhodanese-like domain-containing protein n=1 Tax=Actinopolymorpha alba TaxID=533267 RepID=UPI0012F6F1E7|nr:rhodanese-like domain-containing protein [Actinopolymorpha alba]